MQEMQTADDAYNKQAADAAAQKTSQEALNGGQAQAQPTFLQKWTAPIGRATTQILDSAVNAADSVYNTPGMKEARSATAGVMTGATNMADFVMSHAAGALATAQQPGDDSQARATDPNRDTQAEYNAAEPIWEHTKASVLDFRDAVQVQDPSLLNSLTQSAAQLAVPYMGFSRALSGMHAVAQLATAGALTDASALGPHDMRMADMLALLRHTQGKLGDTLRTLAPDGSAQNAYINYLADRTNESEAEGRFKNVLDGFGVNLIATPLIHSAAVVMKQGYAGLRYMIDNGVGSSGGMVSPASQAGRIGWHGTPHDFDTEAGFDDSKIGTGEGAQSYGYGHYLAESQDVAGHYQQKLVARDSKGGPIAYAQDAVSKAGGDPVKAYKQLTSMAADEQDPSLRSQMQQTAQLIKSGNYQRGSGSMIKAEVPDELTDKMIDHDKLMKDQPSVLQALGDDDRQKLEGMLEDHGQHPDLENYTGSEFRQIVEKAHDEGVLTGGDPMESHSPKLASQYLDSKGIPGVKYADQMSRNPVVTDGKGAKVEVSSRITNLLREAQGTHSGAGGGNALDIAINRAKQRGWNDPKAFYQDREALEKLEELKSKGAKFELAGTKNLVVFKGKNIKVLEKH